MDRREVMIIIAIIGLLAASILIVFFTQVAPRKKDDLSKVSSTTIPTKKDISDQEQTNPVDKKEDIIQVNENYKIATDSDRESYDISNIKFDKKDNYTIVSANIKNIDGPKNIIVRIQYYDKDKNPVASSSLEITDLNKNKRKDFEIKIMNNVITDDYKLYVDFVGEN